MGMNHCRGKGQAIVLCIGGAREALLAEPDHFEIVLGRRLVSDAEMGECSNSGVPCHMTFQDCNK